MKFDINSLPNDPEKLKKMLLELQLSVDKKEIQITEKDAQLTKKDKIITEQVLQINQFIERYELARRKAYGAKSEKLSGGDEVFNEAEETLDDADKETIAEAQREQVASTKKKLKRKPLPKEPPRDIIVIDVPDILLPDSL